MKNNNVHVLLVTNSVNGSDVPIFIILMNSVTYFAIFNSKEV